MAAVKGQKSVPLFTHKIKTLHIFVDFIRSSYNDQIKAVFVIEETFIFHELFCALKMGRSCFYRKLQIMDAAGSMSHVLKVASLSCWYIEQGYKFNRVFEIDSHTSNPYIVCPKCSKYLKLATLINPTISIFFYLISCILCPNILVVNYFYDIKLWTNDNSKNSIIYICKGDFKI